MRFGPDLLAGADEPVRRYFTHAIGVGAPLSRGVRLEIAGRIKAALWLPFRADEQIVGRFDLPPERPEVEVRIDSRGAAGERRALGSARRQGPRLHPLGCEVHAERRFGDLTVPSRLTVSWRVGTPPQAPLFRAEITVVEAAGA